MGRKKKERFPKVVEMFYDPSWAIDSVSSSHRTPHCFNSVVSVRKFRVTVEVVDEPIEVIAERIQTLWDEADNYHHNSPLRAAAETYGVTLQGRFGSKAKR